MGAIEFLIFRATGGQQFIACLLVGLAFGLAVCGVAVACSAIAEDWRARKLRNGGRGRRA